MGYLSLDLELGMCVWNIYLVIGRFLYWFFMYGVRVIIVEVIKIVFVFRNIS